MSRRTVTVWLAGLTVLVALTGRTQGDDQQYGYLVVWKSRYNDKNYRSEWFYGDASVADSVAEELRQFHAFQGVRVITVPVTMSPDGISGKISKGFQAGEGSFARRGTDAFTVTDLWNYSVPGNGGGGGGDPQVISLRKADTPSTPPASTDPSSPASGSGTNRPTAPDEGGRLVFDENTPKGQKPAPAIDPKKALGGNERPVKAEILTSKSDVLKSEQERLDKERIRLNRAAQAGQDVKSDLSKYQEDVKGYGNLVGQVQKDLDAHNLKYNPPKPKPKPPTPPPPTRQFAGKWGWSFDNNDGTGTRNWTVNLAENGTVQAQLAWKGVTHLISGSWKVEAGRVMMRWEEIPAALQRTKGTPVWRDITDDLHTKWSRMN